MECQVTLQEAETNVLYFILRGQIRNYRLRTLVF